MGFPSASSNTATTDATGTATVTPTANATAGSYTVTATAGTVSASFSLTNQAMPVYLVTTLTDDATGIAAHCTDQMLSGATPDASCSLRDAIAAAATIPQSTPTPKPPMPTINFSASALNYSAASPVTYSVAKHGTLSITGNMSIIGPGANLMTINAESAAGIFSVSSTTEDVAATISGFTLSQGLGTNGGAISDVCVLHTPNGQLTVSGVTFNANYATEGGAIYVNKCNNVAVIDSTFNGNTATGNGDSVNKGQNGGGAIHIEEANVTVTNSTFYNNTASGSQGGQTGGGAIYYTGGAVSVVNSTFSGNTAVAFGGGIFEGESGVSVMNSIFTGNTSGGDGAGIYSDNPMNYADRNVYYQNTRGTGAESGLLRLQYQQPRGQRQPDAAPAGLQRRHNADDVSAARLGGHLRRIDIGFHKRKSRPHDHRSARRSQHQLNLPRLLDHRSLCGCGRGTNQLRADFLDRAAQRHLHQSNPHARSASRAHRERRGAQPWPAEPSPSPTAPHR